MKFDNNYDFVKNEEEVLEYWEKDETFKKLLEKNKDGKKYRFIDGPITANNRMKLHHTWGRTLKDTFLRYKGMNGYTSHYRNGFDGQGLWVEVEVEKELGFKTKQDIENYGLDKFTEACVARVKKFAGEITEQSKRLGQWMDWDNSYYTLTDENITSIWYFLQKCNEKGMIKETYKPMPWCARCGTSLSEHEMTGSYHDVEHKAVFFKLPIIGEDYKALVWTTTPWTLTANVGLAVHPNLDYVVVKLEKEDTPLLMCEDVFNKRFKGEGEVLKKGKGTEFAGKEFETCFPELNCQKEVKHPIVCWEEVDSVEGSGIVHIAPGCGAEDFELGESIGLAKIVPIDESGIMTPDTGMFAGKPAKEVFEQVFEELEKRGKLFLVHTIKHSYPYCWRCKQDILFRLVKEWAIDVDVIREDLIRNAKSVKYYPEYQGKRMLDWLNNMGDWNISRRRFYGLPLPFYHCECGHLEVIGSKEELREKAVDPSVVDGLKELHRPWIDDVKIKCPKCGKEISRVPQVGDVWLDAGIVPFSTLKYFSDKEYWKEYFPAEYVVEMHEQIRLWFYSMLFMSTVLENKAPYESVGTHGMITAEDGTKFSKTGFNIDLEEAESKLGIDAIRYLYACTSPQNDVRFGYNMGEEAKKKLLAFYNMIVFFETYASIDKPNLENYKLNEKTLNVTDKWLLKITDEFIMKATSSFESYDTKEACVSFEKYVDEVSNFYIRINRRRFWKSEDDEDKLNAYYVLFNAIKTCNQVMAPIIPFMTDYLWQTVISKYDKTLATSVHLSDWPKVSTLKIEDSIIDLTTNVRNIITLALRARNEANIKVRQPLSTLYVNNSKLDLKDYENIVKSEVNVKELMFVEDFSSLKDEYLTLNFKEAGQALKGEVNTVKELLHSVESSKDLIDQVKSGNTITLGDFKDLPSNLFNIEFKQRENIKVIEENGYTVALNTEISEELKNEGILKDIIRSCQVYRKESKYNVSDRIFISFESKNSEVMNTIKDNTKLIESELLATIKDEEDYTFTYNVEEVDVVVKMKKVD